MLQDTDLATFDEASALKTTAELLYKSTQKRMMSDRPIGTFLSGGLDSSVVAAFIKKFHKENGMDTNLNTFSIGTLVISSPGPPCSCSPFLTRVLLVYSLSYPNLS